MLYEYDELPSSFPRIDQGQTQWCQVATAWVITKYYYPSNTRTLQNIATKMQIPDTDHSATWDKELNYYTSSYQNGAATGGLGKTSSYYGTLGGNYLTYEKVKEQITQDPGAFKSRKKWALESLYRIQQKSRWRYVL